MHPISIHKKGIIEKSLAKDKRPSPQGKDVYEQNFNFLLQCIDKLTVAIRPSPSLIKIIQKELLSNSCMKMLTYTSLGLKNQHSCIEQFEKIKEKNNIKKIPMIAPYFGLLKRIISLLYEDARKQWGDDKVASTFKSVYKRIEKKYTAPDFEGYIPNAAIGKVAATAATLGKRYIERMFDYLIENIIVNEHTDGNHVENNSLPFDRITSLLHTYRTENTRDNDELYLYLLMEDFITRSRWPVVREQYTRQELRALVKKEFNTLLFSPLLKVLFNVKDSENIIIAELLLKSIAKKTVKYIDIKPILQKMNRDFDVRNLDFDAFEEKMVHAKNSEDFLDDIYTALSQLHKMLILAIGKKKTTELFADTFLQLKGTYAQVPLFDEGIKNLPSDLFNEQRRAIINPQAAAAAAVVKRALDLIGGHDLLNKKNVNPKEIKQLFIDIIGPMGELEFDNLSGALDLGSLLAQINGFNDDGLLLPEQVELFKTKLVTLFNR